MERAPIFGEEVFEEKQSLESEGEIEAHGLARVAEAMATFYEGRLRLAELDNEELRRENEALRIAAHQDPLTGAKNARALHEVFERRRVESEGECVLMLVDADKFKPINDTYGHKAGDLVLKEIVRYLESLAREGDMVSRIGGDEFAVLFTNASEDDIRKRFEGDKLQKIVVEYEGQDLEVSLSVGLVKHQAGETLDEFRHRADQRMYENKRVRGNMR